MAHPDIDPHSQTWRTIKARIEEYLGDKVLELQQPEIPERRADYARGHIHAYKTILELADDDDEPEINDAAHIVA